MKTSLLFVALAAIFTLVSISEAKCVNQAVFDVCQSRGNNQLGDCAADNFICRCDARKGMLEKC